MVGSGVGHLTIAARDAAYAACWIDVQIASSRYGNEWFNGQAAARVSSAVMSLDKRHYEMDKRQLFSVRRKEEGSSIKKLALSRQKYSIGSK